MLLNWVFNSTRGSVLLAMIFHAAANTWTDIFPIPAGNSLAWTLWAVGFGIAAIAVVIVYGRRYLARNPDVKAIVVVDPIAPK